MNGEQTDDLTTALRRGADLAPAPPVDLLERVAHRRRQQRRARVAVLAAAAAVAVVAAGVPVGTSLLASSDPAPATRPVDPTPSLAPTPPAPSTTAAPTTSTVPTTVPVTTPPRTSTPPPAPPALVLGPEGLGRLVLGMSVEDAEATGELESELVWDGPGCGQTTTSGSTAVFSPTLGLVYVSAPPGVASPQGVEVGMTYDEVRAAVPGIDIYPGLPDPARSGRGFVAADGWPDRHYRVAWEDGVVTQVSIELRAQDCYE